MRYGSRIVCCPPLLAFCFVSIPHSICCKRWRLSESRRRRISPSRTTTNSVVCTVVPRLREKKDKQHSNKNTISTNQPTNDIFVGRRTANKQTNQTNPPMVCRPAWPCARAPLPAAGYRGNLFADATYDAEDKEADAIYDAIDNRMDSRRKRQREGNVTGIASWLRLGRLIFFGL